MSGRDRSLHELVLHRVAVQQQPLAALAAAEVARSRDLRRRPKLVRVRSDIENKKTQINPTELLIKG